MKTYDPKLVIVTFAGNILTGFAEGTFVTVEREADAYTKVVGSDGEVARVRSRNASGSVTITLMQTSVSNDVLDALAVLDEEANAGSGPLFIEDLLGNTFIAATAAWIRKRSNIEYGAELGSREWVIDVADLKMVNGGSINLP
jgi:hypothetical protein